jgi:TetR/AcrR family transcriptional repressor of uid operon
MGSKIRVRILTTATQCFADNGFHGCSTKEIAAKANVTEGSLFRLFESKDKLFEEALSSSLAALLPQNDFRERLSNPDFRAAILDACSAMYAKTSRQAVRLATYAFLEERGGLAERIEPHLAARISAIASRIRAAVKSREVRKDVNPKDAARMLLLNLFLLRLHSLLMRRADDCSVGHTVEIWLHEIAR